MQNIPLSLFGSVDEDVKNLSLSLEQKKPKQEEIKPDQNPSNVNNKYIKGGPKTSGQKLPQKSPSLVTQKKQSQDDLNLPSWVINQPPLCGVGIQKFRGNVVVAKRFAESNAREDLARVLKRSIKGLQRQDLKRLVESAISKKSDMRNMQFYSMVCIEQDQVLEKVPRHNFTGSHHRNDDSTAKKKKALLESAEELWKKRNHHVKAYKAIEIWEKATILYPVDTLIHLNLLYAYQ
jgi:hypothetical protein